MPPGEGILPVWQGVLNSTGGNILRCGFRPECDQRTGRRQTKIVREEKKKHYLRNPGGGEENEATFQSLLSFPNSAQMPTHTVCIVNLFPGAFLLGRECSHPRMGEFMTGGERKVIFGFIFPSTHNFFFLNVRNTSQILNPEASVLAFGILAGCENLARAPKAFMLLI